MNSTLKSILLIVAGYVLGTIAHMAMLQLGSAVIPPPEGVNTMDPQSLIDNMDLFTNKHFIFPYIAHQIGGFLGAILIGKFGGLRWHALLVGALFMAGGIFMTIQLPQPVWFSVLDIISYLPGAFLGWKIGRSLMK